jgi:uncharacterized protein YjbI with pentapeptide repeats
MAESRTYSGNGHSATIANPENITRDECLALARCGAQTWNQWRREFPSKFFRTSDRFHAIQSFLRGNCANFSGVEFIESIDFSGFEFGAGANFEQATFHKQSDFRRSNFDDGCNFAFCKFLESVTFSGSTFLGETQFSVTEFRAGAVFEVVTFGSSAKFSGARFDGEVFFDCKYPSGSIAFDEVTFGGHISRFSATSFKQEDGRISNANFAGAHFLGASDFSNLKFIGVTKFSKSLFSQKNSRITKDGRDHWLHWKAEERFVRFSQPPLFFNTSFEEDVSFERADFPSVTGFETSARAYRALRKIFASLGTKNEENRFFRLEMAEEAKAAEHSRDPAKWLYIAYRELANFGFSVQRPVLLLVITLLLMLPLYAWQAGLQACWPNSPGCSLTGPLFQFAAAHALPGFEKLAEPASKALFGEQMGVWTVLTLLHHKAVSLLALFLIGLALRNLFKMK